MQATYNVFVKVLDLQKLIYSVKVVVIQDNLNLETSKLFVFLQ